MSPFRMPKSKSAVIALSTIGALVVVTPTTAVAARLIDSSDIRNQSIRSWDIAPDGIGKSELRADSVGWAVELNDRTRAKIRSLAGKDGKDGKPGADGANGADGADGANGVDGANGANGDSAYDVAVAEGFLGNAPEWLASLIGPAGPQGQTGANGEDGANGTNGVDGQTGETGPAGPMGPAGPAGPAGPIGVTGPAGPQGPAGASGGMELKDGNGDTVGTVLSIARNSVTVMTSKGYLLVVGWDGKIAPAQAYYTSAGCTGTAYLNSGGDRPSWLYGKTLVYLGSANTLAVPAALDGTGAAANTAFTAATIDNPDCGDSAGERHGWKLKATNAADTGLPAGVTNQFATPLAVN